MILVGDIGGTNARFALASADGNSFRLEREKHYPTPHDLPALVSRYLAEVAVGTVDAVALCGAGPVADDGSIRLTNHFCVLAPDAIAAAAGVARAQVVNDFEAIAQSLPALRPDQLRNCGGGSALADAPRVVIGAGTGLGVAAAISNGGEWIVLPGEGGHVDLAPVDDEEWRVLQQLRQAHGRVSAELVLSGPGLDRLYLACGGTRQLLGPAIAAAAAEGDPPARQALRLFTQWLGRFAGNLALTLLARGGVYIAGGIVPAWGEDFDAALFRAGFEDKAPFAERLAEIPSWVVTHPQPGMLGLARLASLRKHTGS